jgi:hypothetical protein
MIASRPRADAAAMQSSTRSIACAAVQRAALCDGRKKLAAASPCAGGGMRLSTQTSCSNSAIACSAASAKLAPLPKP